MRLQLRGSTSDGFKDSRANREARSPVLAGVPAGTLEQVRDTLEAQVSFEFLSWTKLTMAFATGSQHMNLLASASGATPSADGAQAIPAVTVQTGSTASR